MIGKELSIFREKELKQRIERLEFAKKQELVKFRETAENIHVTYVLHQVEPYGGTKIILEHANRLVKTGVRATLVSHFLKPDWYPIKADYVCVPFDREVTAGIPECDVIVATSWNHINACIETGIAPVVFFDQGGSHLFDWDNLEDGKKQTLKKMIGLPKFIFTVSKGAAKILEAIYNAQDVRVFHNALDESIFYAGNLTDGNSRSHMMIVGSEKDEFKRIPDLIQAHENITEQGYGIDLIWVSKDIPDDPYGKVIVRPPQKAIGDLYRKAKIFVSGSRYESFSLPVLEAMACGCPVVTTANVGTLEYCRDGYNCLIAETGNPRLISRKIIEILDNRELYIKLQKNGLETANTFKWGKIIPELIDYYKEVAAYKPVNRITPG